jgi:hypothetical protein
MGIGDWEEGNVCFVPKYDGISTHEEKIAYFAPNSFTPVPISQSPIPNINDKF